jgi:hypothetical protein
LAQTPGPPETVLAGVDIHQTKIPEIIRMYGEPEGVFAAPAPFPAGTKQYNWGRLTLTLLVLTEPSPSGDRITAIQISGEGDGKPISSTGRGLKLDDKQQQIKKIYRVKSSGALTTLHWSSGETLMIRLNDKQRVDRLELKLESADPRRGSGVRR